jgi:hypothetical protein
MEFSMTSPLLHTDDSSPLRPTPLDKRLHQQLRKSVTRYFYEACDGVIQALLMKCRWNIATTAQAWTLVIECPDAAIYRRVLDNLQVLAKYLSPFGQTARIRICPPDSATPPTEVRVDEYLLN